MQIIKKTRRRETREDLNGPRISSEEPNPVARDTIGFKHSDPTLSSVGIPLKSGSGHRPVTKPKLFKPTLYKSYCEGSFVCKPNNSIGPQRNRVLTIGAVCGKLARWRRWRWNQLFGKQKFLWSPPSPATYSCCSDVNFC